MSLPLSTGSIAQRLSVAFFILGAIATVAITSIQVYQEYQTEIIQINAKLDRIPNTHAPTIAASVWSISEKQIQNQLQGLLNTPGFDYIEIATPDGGFWSAGEKRQSDMLIRQIPLKYAPASTTTEYGTLTVQAGTQQIYNRIKARATNTLLYFGSWIFILAGCQFLIFQRLVTRHLNHLAQYTSSLNFNTSQDDLTLARRPSLKHSQDELHLLTTSVNAMRKMVVDAMAKVKRNEQLFRGLFHNADNAIWQIDLSGMLPELEKIRESGITDIRRYLSQHRNVALELSALVNMVQVNDATVNLFEAESREHLLKNFPLTIKDSGMRAIINQIVAIWDKKSTFHSEVEFTSFKGKDLTTIMSYLIPTTTDGFTSIPVSIFDITERKQNEQELLTQSEIITNMAEGAYLVNCDDSAIVYASPTSEKIFGYEAGEMLGIAATILHANDKPNPGLTATEIFSKVKQDKPWSGDVYSVRKNGDLFWGFVNMSSFAHPKFGNVWLCVHADITQRKAVEDALRRTQKMEALGKLTGGIAHDYNNMLAIINGYSELLQSTLTEQPESLDYAMRIHHAAKRGAHMTNKLLSFSKAKIADEKPANINELLLNEKQIIEKTITPRIKLSFNLSEQLWPVRFSIDDFEDAIVNLSINAMHAISGSGKLVFSTRNIGINTKQGSLLNLAAGDYVMLSITDNGCGMDKNTSDRMFEPFYSTKGEQGTGLGLSQVYGFVERSNGIVEVESSTGLGTQFIFYFPRLLIVNADNQTETGRNTISTRGDETILVVDDEEGLLELSSALLEQHGYHVKVATNAQLALDTLANNKIDLMISDVVMPGMNGFELASKVTRHHPSTKIQLVSGYNDNLNAGDVDEKLITNKLTKPFPNDTLLRQVRLLLDE